LLVFFRVKKPGRAKPFVISIAEKQIMADLMIYTLDLGPVDPDVVEREVTIVVGGNTTTTKVSIDSNSVEVSGPQDAEASLTIVDVDDAGNKSVPVEHSLVLSDTVAPGANAVVTVKDVKEIADGAPEPPVEEPPVEEPPVEEPPVEEPPVE